ncbi:MAG: hypothetical protein A2583_10500 [Bdellovibrionales bacterium RIFOXYD1_FULL_53_11]|nr:MAG: hypothetical protein A2583_10500 [Bdellovibrionales bacterium RIFOXYD1_FULL_53_11]
METLNRKYIVIALAAIASASLAGCGDQAYQETPVDTATAASPVTPSSSTTTTETTTETETTTLPALTFSYEVTGASGVDPVDSFGNILTDNILKVKVVAGTAGQIRLSDGTYSNWSAAYQCVQYKISALGQTVTTQVLAVDGGNSYICPGAPSEQTIDFSSRLTSGHGAVTVTVQAYRYDSCLNYGYNFGGCAMHTVYYTHTVTGTLDIQTNGTGS